MGNIIPKCISCLNLLDDFFKYQKEHEIVTENKENNILKDKKIINDLENIIK